jgi:hypothetical protein
VKSKKKFGPTPEQRRAMRRKTSFGVVFIRRSPIDEVKNKNGDWVKARSPGKPEVTSLRRFGSVAEAKRHGSRFKRIENHKGFKVIVVKKSPNAYVNLRTGKTNPLIGLKRTNRR